ncbi:MAG TPA: DUF1800 family protein [Terracidiphilus sp.]|nr:DUF1800 family protein [Terracidiphilus sp.]
MALLRRVLVRMLLPNLMMPAAMVATEPMPAAAGQPAAPARSAYVSAQMRGDQRIVYALDRFTFGPRPGDVEAVRAMGLDNWFEQQLHPATIDNSDLNQRLNRFPAMRLSTRDLLFRAPSNALIRQAANGRVPIPENPFLHAVYENAIYRLDERKEAKTEKASAGGAQTGAQTGSAGANPPAMNAGAAADANSSNAGGVADRSMASGGAGAAPVTDPKAMALAAAMDSLDDDPQTEAVLEMGPNERVMRLIAMQPAEFEEFMQSLRPAQRARLVADLSPEMREAVEELENPERLVAGELLAERLTRDIYSNAQLEEVMTDFWLNHFNIYLRKNEQMPYYLVSYERDTIRPFALGKFEDLLEAVAHSPAMLVYLDNAESIGPDSPAAERARMAAFRRPGAQRGAAEGLNENYARELMELHTLGVNGGYTQADVIQVARILTGWTVERPQFGDGFQFNPMRHEPGTKKVMGQKFKDNGEKEGEALLHFLATRPATAEFLSRKLAIRFVSDDPPPALVQRMAKTYLSTGGDIAAVLRTLYRSPEFWATGDFRAKVKTPLEFVVSAARASNADVENYEPLINALRQMGMPLYGCVPPSGWDWKAATWVSTSALVDRMNFALALAGNRLPGISVMWSGDASAGNDAPPSAEAAEAALEAIVLPGGVSDSTRAAALEQFSTQMAQLPPPLPANARGRPARVDRIARRGGGVSAEERQDEVLAGLLIGSPEFQRR